ncbi:MAG: hypothetical protein HY973_04590 [Candidatus Kerfeldbacteria bacterium]|nr:hypothetical protein [Candidatus Kerfeldbacteria bacterium]
MNILLFENNQTADLYPITLTRPAFDILCGGTTLYKLLAQHFNTKQFIFKVRDYLTGLVAQEFGRQNIKSDRWLFLDGSVIPQASNIVRLVKAAAKGKSFLVKTDQQVVAALVDLATYKLTSTKLANLKLEQIQPFLLSLRLPVLKLSLPRFNQVWEVVVANKNILGDNLKHLSRGYRQLQRGVFVGQKVKIESNVVFDVSQGPIVIGNESVISSLAVLRGPLYIGQKCLVKSLAELKESSCIGDVCRLGGEIEASIMQGYANKQHYGYLGHAYVGSWVNLGAGTTNSDLKNTYGEIKINGRSTGQQFMGCIIGDYSKSAIGTLIYTGKIIGVNGLLYGTIKNNVPSFTNAASKLIACPLTVAWKMQQAMFKRRQVKVTLSARRLLQFVYKLTTRERQQAAVEVGKLVI